MIITKETDFKKVKDNSIIGEGIPKLINSTIEFVGKGNILYCDKNVTLEDSKIVFHGNNSIVYLSSNYNNYKLDVSMYNNNTLYFGKDNYINQKLLIILSEEKNLFVGNECLFSTGIVFRTADPHLIYDNKSHERLNYSKSIYLGDHIWVGQNTIILKGTQIDSGSIIGAMSLVSGKRIKHNTINAGVPIREIKKKIFWTRQCVHTWTKKDTENNKKYEKKGYIYHYDDKKSILFSDIEKELTIDSPTDKIEYLKNISNNTSQNRFVHLIDHVRIKKLIIKLKKIIKKIIHR